MKYNHFPMKKWIKIFGSLSFALWLIGGLVTLLTLSTLLESAQGTPFVQKFFYQAGWFDVFLALFGLNILCSALSRWPYKKYHTGFLIVHAGILIILTGSLLSRYGGVDGQMALFENETGNRILLPGYELVTHLPDHGIKILVLDKPAKLAQTTLVSTAPDEKVMIKKALTGVTISETVEEGGTNIPANLGIVFTIKSDMAGANQSLSLFQHHPSNPSANRIALGPATFELKDSPPLAVKETSADEAVTKPRLRVTKKDTGETFTWDLDPLPTQDLPLGSTGVVIKNLRYLPDARVDDSHNLVNVSEAPLNPAVAFEAVDGSGNREVHTRFEHFPDFDSLHGREKKNLLGLSVDLQTPGAKKTPSKPNTGLQFFIKDGRWAYHSRSSKEADQEGFLELGQEYPAGWMDFTFTVEKFYSRAQIVKKVNAAAGSKGMKADIAIEITVEKNGREISSDWVLPAESLRLDTPKGPLIAAIRQRSMAVPFSLTLKDFRKVDYPGTAEALSFESDVALEDKAENLKIEKKISMNKPLDYKGYRIFQSSYSQDPESGETSVFTVAKNPGIWFIYIGSIVMCLGIITVFYIKPLSSFSGRGNSNV